MSTGFLKLLKVYFREYKLCLTNVPKKRKIEQVCKHKVRKNRTCTTRHI